MDDGVSILMATFNGENYISEQIESLIVQSFTNWQLIIRDDHSTDGTRRIIEHYEMKDNRILVLTDNYGNLKSCQNFSALMQVRPINKYVMFCDQDDIWMPTKIEEYVSRMEILEATYGANVSLAIYGTYIMIDEGGNVLNLPVPDYSTKPSINLLLSQNYLYGCTMMINRELLELSMKIPLTAENHDYWVALIGVMNNAYFSYIHKPLIYYRQHRKNVSGTYANAFILNRLERIFSNSEINSIGRRALMLESLSIQSNRNDSSKNSIILKGYIDKLRSGGWSALKFCLSNKIMRRGKMQTMLFYFNMLRFGGTNK